MKHDSNHPHTSPPPSSTDHQYVREAGATKVVTVCPLAEELRLKSPPGPSTSPSPSSSTLHMCPVQGCRAFPFKTQKSLAQHVSTMHPHPCATAAAKEKGEEYHFHCPQADCVYNSMLKQRWFSTLEHLRYHYVNTHDEKRFACTKCEKRFGWRRDQEHHERECGLTFACSSCPSKYPSRRSLLTHCQRKRHPVPPQFEKPVQKSKESGVATSSTPPVASSTVGKSCVSLAVAVTLPATSAVVSTIAALSRLQNQCNTSGASGISRVVHPVILPVSSGAPSPVHAAGVSSVSSGAPSPMSIAGASSVISGAPSPVLAAGVLSVSSGAPSTTGVSSVSSGAPSPVCVAGVSSVSSGAPSPVRAAGVSSVSSGAPSPVRAAGVSSVSSGAPSPVRAIEMVSTITTLARPQNQTSTSGVSSAGSGVHGRALLPVILPTSSDATCVVRPVTLPASSGASSSVRAPCVSSVASDAPCVVRPVTLPTSSDTTCVVCPVILPASSDAPSRVCAPGVCGDGAPRGILTAASTPPLSLASPPLSVYFTSAKGVSSLPLRGPPEVALRIPGVVLVTPQVSQPSSHAPGVYLSAPSVSLSSAESLSTVPLSQPKAICSQSAVSLSVSASLSASQCNVSSSAPTHSHPTTGGSVSDVCSTESYVNTTIVNTGTAQILPAEQQNISFISGTPPAQTLATEQNIGFISGIPPAQTLAAEQQKFGFMSGTSPGQTLPAEQNIGFISGTPPAQTLPTEQNIGFISGTPPAQTLPTEQNIGFISGTPPAQTLPTEQNIGFISGTPPAQTLPTEQNIGFISGTPPAQTLPTEQNIGFISGTPPAQTLPTEQNIGFISGTPPAQTLPTEQNIGFISGTPLAQTEHQNFGFISGTSPGQTLPGEQQNIGFISGTSPAKTLPAEQNIGFISGTPPAKTAAHSRAGRQKKLRPILPKCQRGLVVVGAGSGGPVYAVQDGGAGPPVLHSPPLSWLQTADSNNATEATAEGGGGGGVNAVACQTSMGSTVGGVGGRVQAPVVHMATQVSWGAHPPPPTPAPTCHAGTQVYGHSQSQVRAESSHTAVQTCVQTTHNATQLAAPLPDSQGMLHLARQGLGEEEQRQVCAVAIQTGGGQVHMVNMAIQATAHPHHAPLSLDVVRLCEGQSEGGVGGGSGGGGGGVPSATHTASQTSFPYILLNKATSTSSTGTQAASAACPPDDTDVASRGIQTSVTLIHRPKLGTMAAQTQTSGDATAVVSPWVAEDASGWPAHGGSRQVKKRSTRSREAQTQSSSPRRKKGRRGKGGEEGHGGCMQEVSMAAETPAQQSPQQTAATSGWTDHAVEQSHSRDTGSHHRHSSSSRSQGQPRTRRRGSSAATTPPLLHNPSLSVSATPPQQERPPHVWDPFLTSSSTPTAPSPPPCSLSSSPQLDELLSQYRADLGVQTPQDFQYPFTAEFGVQTAAFDDNNDVLSTTADLAVQTLDAGQPCTADFGVQTVTSVLGCLLENLDADLTWEGGGDGDHAAASSSTTTTMPHFHCRPENNNATTMTSQGLAPSTSTSDLHTATHTHGGSQVFDLQFEASSLPPSSPPHAGSAPKLFDSFDSDLSFSDCGTGTEDFFASTHTQTHTHTHGGLELTIGGEGEEEEGEGEEEGGCLPPPPPGLSSLCAHPGLPPTPTHCVGTASMDLMPGDDVSSLEGEVGDMSMDLCCASPPAGLQQSRPTSTSTTDTDLLSGVPAMDMHTQTADDLLTFLMNNMETQTTEELSEDLRMAVADTHTQTTTSVLLTPPHPLHWEEDDQGGSASGYGYGVVGVGVSTETQTSGFDPHHEELFVDTEETQAMLW
ncbi:uncharacterized protein LOC143285684 [Babylonia areolata]|uniref:uncharacterized protein LOC143285684 n=1 Tax=Babylonia areolata TaxID=304850 RepID=UPI003FD6078C